ncbi:LysR family transcriptional regulator [Lacticaseibacillus paracasei]
MAIADAGTITAAANAIHISQPALSRQMQIEQNSVQSCLTGKSRAISLTANGTYLVNRARQILHVDRRCGCRTLSEWPMPSVVRWQLVLASHA